MLVREILYKNHLNLILLYNHQHLHHHHQCLLEQLLHLAREWVTLVQLFLEEKEPQMKNLLPLKPQV